LDPAITSSIGPVKPITALALVSLVEVEPVPSWPKPLAPKHFTPEVAIEAHVKSNPTVTPDAFADNVTALGVGVEVVVRLWPIWPLLFFPKHFTVPFVSNAHVCAPPVAII